MGGSVQSHVLYWNADVIFSELEGLAFNSEVKDENDKGNHEIEMSSNCF